MNTINFNLSTRDMMNCKKWVKICKNRVKLYIHTNSKNYIVMTLVKTKEPPHQFNITIKTKQKSEKEFYILSDKVIWKITRDWTNILCMSSPISIPPIDDYECSILIDKNKLEMKSKNTGFEFSFPITRFEKNEFSLFMKKNLLPN